MRLSGLLFPEPVLAQAAIGSVASWTVRSSRDPEVWYTVVLYPDGLWSCDCPAGEYGSRADGGCKHIDARRADWERSLDLAAAI
jgi:hypothetical protein